MDKFEDIINKFSLEYFGESITEDDEGNDILPDNIDSALEGDEDVRDDTKKLVHLTNILLKSLKFKPSNEFKAYINMPQFSTLSQFEKLTAIRNVLVDHPEKIVQEAEGDEEEPTEDVPEEFGEIEPVELDETTESDILNLIIRSIGVNPHVMDETISKLPSSANENNYIDIIDTIERSLI